MSDTDAAPAADAAAEQQAPAQETDWKAEARKWEARAKENTSAAQRLAEIEEASKTEEQKRAEHFAALESELSTYKTREQVAAWKAEVATATGVPAVALAGSTKEEIEAHAATLKPLITTTDVKKGAIGPYVPPEGTAPSGAVGSTTGDMFAQAVEDSFR